MEINRFLRHYALMVHFYSFVLGETLLLHPSRQMVPPFADKVKKSWQLLAHFLEPL